MERWIRRILKNFPQNVLVKLLTMGRIKLIEYLNNMIKKKKDI